MATTSYDPGIATRPSLSRGASTLVFDLQALRDFPNAVPTIEGSDTRRSDMVWSLLNRFVAGRSVVHAPLPVRQEREANIEADQRIDTLVNDICGHALFSSLRDLLMRKSQERESHGLIAHSPELLDFGEAEIEEAVTHYTGYLEERTHAFEMNFNEGERAAVCASTLLRPRRYRAQCGPGGSTHPRIPKSHTGSGCSQRAWSLFTRRRILTISSGERCKARLNRSVTSSVS